MSLAFSTTLKKQSQDFLQPCQGTMHLPDLNSHQLSTGNYSQNLKVLFFLIYTNFSERHKSYLLHRLNNMLAIKDNQGTEIILHNNANNDIYGRHSE